MQREPFEVGDARTAILDLEAHGTGTGPVDLDHETPVGRGLGVRPFQLGSQRLVVAPGPASQERLNLRMVHELHEKIEVVGPGPADRDHRGNVAGPVVSPE